MHDDHSYEALMGEAPIVMQPMDAYPAMGQMPGGAGLAEEVDENPVVSLDCEDSVSPFQPYLFVTAAFTGIQNSVTADLYWYVGDEQVSSETGRLLVEGSTVVTSVRMKAAEDGSESNTVRLEVQYQGKVTEASKSVLVERFELSDTSDVRTEEIRVTMLEECSMYRDPELTSTSGRIQKGSEGLLLGYENFDEGRKALELQLLDGSGVVWVDSKYAEITQEDCTTRQDFSQETKEGFVNDMGYDSQTDYLVWVSLYTQRVNVFKGTEGQWELVKTFDCSTGMNDTPTTTGTFTYSTLDERWDLGNTYVAPVMVFNGGEAFTSRPRKVSGNKLADETIGKPASGGSVRMLDEDIAWMVEKIPLDTMVVVY